MKFHSTRSVKGPYVGFEDVVLNGLAPDGGIYVPQYIPKIDQLSIARWRSASYIELAIQIISLFSGTSLNAAELYEIIKSASHDFRLPTWTQLVPLQHVFPQPCFVLELFHGPTFSFKDYPLTILCRIMDHFLERRNRIGTVVVATSGDTGSAAIAGIAPSKKASIVVLIPKGRVSDLQRKQMTTVTSPNVENILVEGTFDDCQRLMKMSLARNKGLLALNSVNFGRIVAQIVYYFWTTFRLMDLGFTSSYDLAIPTGNFGNILAAWYAKQMGCPIRQLIIGSNVNDILPRVLQTGSYKPTTVVPTISPAIDIQISSNFERLLHHMEPEQTAEYYSALDRDGSFVLSRATLEKLRADFCAHAATDEETLKVCKEVFLQSDYILDPHSAVAVSAAKSVCNDADNRIPILIVATAHPSKFAPALSRVISEQRLLAEMPSALRDVLKAPEQFKESPVSHAAITELICTHVRKWEIATKGAQN